MPSRRTHAAERKTCTYCGGPATSGPRYSTSGAGRAPTRETFHTSSPLYRASRSASASVRASTVISVSIPVFESAASTSHRMA